LQSIPEEMFAHCQHLVETNIGEFSALREMGDAAFLNCWAIHELEIPAQCQVVRVRQCGIQKLDLRYGLPTIVDAFGCALLKTLILPPAFRGGLDVSWATSLRSLTMGGEPRDGWLVAMRPDELRCVGACFPFFSSVDAMLSRARALGEVAAVSGGNGEPLLSCKNADARSTTQCAVRYNIGVDLSSRVGALTVRLLPGRAWV
jgi:hypothetical protein